MTAISIAENTSTHVPRRVASAGASATAGLAAQQQNLGNADEQDGQKTEQEAAIGRCFHDVKERAAHSALPKLSRFRFQVLNFRCRNFGLFR